MMNCNKQYTIKVTEGNAFGLLLQLKSRTFQSSVPIDEDIDATHLEDIVIKVNNEVFTDFTVDESGVLMNIPADMAVGTYNVELTGSYYDVEIRAGYFQCFSIVPWSYQSDAVNYIPGSPIATEAAYVVVGIIDDQELEDLKAELRLKIAAAEAAKEAADQAKEDFDEKAENLDNLDNVAQQGSDPTATNTAIKDAIDNIDIDTSTIAKQGSNASATLTATQAAVVDGNDTAVGVAKEIRGEVGTGSDTAAETGTLFAVIKWIKDKVKSITGYALQGSDSTATNTAISGQLGDVADALDYMEQNIMPTLNVGIPQMTIPSTTASQELTPNTCYIFAERTTNLTLTLGSPVVGIANEYHCFIITGSTAPTITWPTGISWNGGSAPTIASDKTYEISILNNVAACFEV